MTFEKELCNGKVHTTDSSKRISTKHSLLHLAFVYLLVWQATSTIVSAQAARPTGEDPSQPSHTTATYRYAVPLTLALEAATEAVRVCAQHGYLVTATAVDMDGVPQVVLRGDGATIHTRESSFDKDTRWSR